MIKKWLEKYFPNYVHYYAYGAQVENILKEIKKEDIVLMHEYNVAWDYTSWLQKFITRIYERLKISGSRIVQLPSTVCWVNPNDKILFDNPNLLFLVRDPVSLQIAKENFNCESELMPDFAYYLQSEVLPKSVGREKVCMILRSLALLGADQQNLSVDESNEIIRVTKDTHLLKTLTYDLNTTFRTNTIECAKNFGNYEVIMTDRFHGVVFSALTNTPCIAVTYGCKIPHKLLQQEFFPSLKCIYDNNEIHDALQEVLSKPVVVKDTTDYFVSLAQRIKGWEPHKGD